VPLHRQTRLALVASVVVVAAIGGAYLFFAVGLSGGPGQFLMRFKRKPDPAKLEPQRTAAERDARRALDQLGASVGLTTAPPPSWEALHDQCYQGQHNFAVQDSYAYRCSLRITRYYGAGGDFRQLLGGLDRTLASQGWKGGDLQRVVSNYYDRYFGPGKPKPADPSLHGTYLISNLPQPLPYRRGTLELSIGYAERATTDLLLLELLQQVGHNGGATPISDRRRFIDVAAAFASATADHPYFVAIALETDYFVK
jgi:hypothetical protein